MDPENRTAYTFQWNANVQRTLGRNYLVEVAYTGSRSYNVHKRYNINQARPGTTPIETRVPYPAFQSAILYSSDGGWAQFNGLSFRLEKRYSAGLFFLANYQISKNTDNGSGEIEANDTAFAWDFDADESLSRYHQRHRSAFSSVTSCPSGPASAGSRGRRRRLLPGRLAGAGRRASGQRLPLHGHIDQRLPVRIVHSAARQLRAGREEDKGESRRSDTKLGGSTRPPTRWPPPGTQGTAGRNTVRGPGNQRVDFSITKRFPLAGLGSSSAARSSTSSTT